MGFFSGIVSAVKSIVSSVKGVISAVGKALTTGNPSDVNNAITQIDNTINEVDKLIKLLEGPKKQKTTTGAEDSGILPTWGEVKGFFQRKEDEISDYIVKGRNYLEGVVIAGSKDLFMDPGIDAFSAANRMLESVGLTPKGSTSKFYAGAKRLEKEAEDIFADKYVSDKKLFYKGAYDADKASAVLGAYQAAVGLGEVKAGITTMEAGEPLIAADGVGVVPEVAGATIAIKGAVDSAWGGSISYNSMQNQNIDFAKMEGAGSSGKGVGEAPNYIKDNRVPLDKETVLSSKDYSKTNIKVKGAQVYKNGDKYYYRDTFHTGEASHLEVFDKRGNHIGEANPQTGELIPGTADPTKKINVK